MTMPSMEREYDPRRIPLSLVQDIRWQFYLGKTAAQIAQELTPVGIEPHQMRATASQVERIVRGGSRKYAGKDNGPVRGTHYRIVGEPLEDSTLYPIGPKPDWLTDELWEVLNRPRRSRLTNADRAVIDAAARGGREVDANALADELGVLALSVQTYLRTGGQEGKATRSRVNMFKRRAEQAASMGHVEGVKVNVTNALNASSNPRKVINWSYMNRLDSAFPDGPGKREAYEWLRDTNRDLIFGTWVPESDPDDYFEDDFEDDTEDALESGYDYETRPSESLRLEAANYKESQNQSSEYSERNGRTLVLDRLQQEPRYRERRGRGSLCR